MRTNAFLFGLLSSALFVSGGAFAEGSATNDIVCTLAATEGSQTSHAEIAVDADEDVQVVSNDWLYFGENEDGEKVKYNYRIWLSISRGENNERRLELTLDEELVMQDEIGSKTSDIPEGNEAFCHEPLTSRGQIIANVTCFRKS